MKIVYVFLLTLPTLFAQQPAPVQQTSAAPAVSLSTRTVKPDFPFDIDLKDGNGQTVNSSKLLQKNSKPTVLMFWLTTCGPCKMELTAIAQKFNDWKKETDFDFYAISTDFPARTEQFYTRVKESKWPFPAYHDFNREFRFVMPGELNGLPQLFVFDKTGKIMYHTRKYTTGDEDKLFEVLKRG
jgi:thiol-disulfide isomerase/thioredoxin